MDKGESIIVFDVEGVDGRERGEKEAVRTSLVLCVTPVHRALNAKHHSSRWL